MDLDPYINEPALPNACIYIAIDIRALSLCKVGFTTQEDPAARLNGGRTYNPFLTLYTVYRLSNCTRGCSLKELRDFEGYIHRKSILGKSIKHLHSGKSSEWFWFRPDEMESLIDHWIARRNFTVDGWNLFMNDAGDDMDHVINQSRLARIKQVVRPAPDDVLRTLRYSGIPAQWCDEYLTHLRDYHSAHWYTGGTP